MIEKVSEKALEFDREFLAEISGENSTNRKRLNIVCRALKEAIRTDLTPRQREVLLLYYHKQMKMYQIAAMLGIAPSTVSHTIKRAKLRLKKSLRFYMEFLNCRF